MKHTFATMLLAALFCAIAAPGMAQGEQPNVYSDNDGGTVKFYGVKPTSNSTPEEITQAEPGSTVYFVPVPDDFHTTEGLQLQAVKTADSDVAESRAGGVGYAKDITIETDVAGSLYHFTMPAGGVKVRVSATFGKRTATVKYLDPTKPADQQECEVEAYILDKPVSKLFDSGEEGTWYVCTTRATENGGKGLVIDGTLNFQNYVNLILADGCKMTVSAENGSAIYSSYGFLSIYAQSTGTDMGQLVATSNSNSDYDGIYTSFLTINGGAITASGPKSGICCAQLGDNTDNTENSINGGRVSATGTGTGSYGIESHDNMSITGGQVTATGQASGIKVDTGGLDIALSSADDFVEASGYNIYAGGVNVYELRLGAVGTDGSGCYLASTLGESSLTPFAYVAGGITLSAEQQAALAGKRIALASKGLTYIDAKGKLQNISTDIYLDESDAEKPYTDNDFTYVITGEEQEIGTDGKTMWYVCDKSHTYKSQFGIRGKMHLILTERGIVDVIPDNDATAVIGYNGADLNIYGQSLTSGHLHAIAKGNHAGIDIPGSFTLNSGYVTAQGNYGLKSGSAITINGGFMMTEGSDVSTDCVGDFTFNGGQFAARSPSGTGIVSSNGNIVLGWSDPDDYIYAKSFSCEKGQLSATEGKRFVAYKTEKNPDYEFFDHNITTNEATAIVSGTAGTDGYTLGDIGGKTLRPIDGNLVSTTGADISVGTLSGTTFTATDPDFTITTDAGTESEVTTHYYIYSADNKVNMKYTGEFGTDDKSVTYTLTGATPDDYDYFGGTNGAHQNADGRLTSFTMPANDVTVSASFNRFTLPGGYCGKSDVNNGKNLVWTVTDVGTGSNQVRTLTISKNPDDSAISGQTNFNMASYGNDNSDNFAPWIKPNAAGNGSDGLKYPITTVTIADGVTSIGREAFENCRSLQNVTIGSSVTSIGNQAFDHCSGLQNVTIGNDVTTIGGYAFRGCEELQEVSIGSSVTTIGDHAFDGCKILQEVTIPASVTTIESNAFYDCFGLTVVTMLRNDPPSLGNIYVFENCLLKLILVPNETAYAAYNAAGGGWDGKISPDIATEDITYKSLLAPSEISLAKNTSGWGTYCHSYPVSYSLSEGATAYTISGLNDAKTAVTTTATTGNIVAPFTPLLLNYTAPDNNTETDNENVTLTALPATATTDSYGAIVSNGGTGWNYYGNTTGTTLTHTAENDGIPALTGGWPTYILHNGTFVLVDIDEGIPAHRCVLSIGSSSAARVLTIGIGDETTAIESEKVTVNSEKFAAATVWYDLQGRKLDKQPTKKGLYINNGKKTVIK